jgi:hypothetical protein
MKTKLKITLSIVMLLVIGLAYSANCSSLPLKSILCRKLHIPEELKIVGFNEKVKVVFMINETKHIQVLEIVTTNEKLKRSVKAQLEKIHFPFAEIFNEKYTFELNFKVL